MGNTIAENMSLSILKKVTKNGILRKRRRIDGYSVMKRFKVKAESQRQRVGRTKRWKSTKSDFWESPFIRAFDLYL